MLFQIWSNEFEGGISLCQKDSWESKLHRLHAIGFKLGLLEEKTELIAEYNAKTHLEAGQKRNEIMGWEEYQPSRLENGEMDPVYLEDLDKMYGP